MGWTTATPTTDQERKAARFVELVAANRATVERALNTGKAARDCDTWIKANGYAAILPSPWGGASDNEIFTTIARRATLLERYRAGINDRILGCRDTPGIVGDVNIVGPAPAPEGSPPVYSLGIIPVIFVVVGGVVLLAGAITTCLGFYASTKKAEEETKRKIADLDLAAAKAGGSVAASWNDYKKTNAEANGGILGALGKNLGTIAVIGGILALVIIGSKALPQRREANA